MQTSKQLHNRRKQRVRTSIRRTANGRPRLSVFRSGKHIYAQVIDDGAGKTLVAASSVDSALKDKLKRGADKAAAAEVGKLVAERAVAAGIKEVVFDRGGYLFHGRVKALADAAREGGLAF
ncbi:MAG TPA: 50S ribosomal protein L18 [Kiloniellaceae bacterium]